MFNGISDVGMKLNHLRKFLKSIPEMLFVPLLDVWKNVPQKPFAVCHVLRLDFAGRAVDAHLPGAVPVCLPTVCFPAACPHTPSLRAPSEKKKRNAITHPKTRCTAAFFAAFALSPAIAFFPP